MQPLFSLTSQNRHFQISFRRADKISENDNDPMDIWEIMQQRRVVLEENGHHQSDVNRAMIKKNIIKDESSTVGTMNNEHEQ